MDTQKILAALRVLTAITYGRKPDKADVEWLRSQNPEYASLDSDELACAVIQKASSDRQKVKSPSRGGIGARAAVGRRIADSKAVHQL